MKNPEIIAEYENVKESLDNAIQNADSIIVAGNEENTELFYIRSTLQQLNDEFKAEISSLESSSEWDRLCVAFFGETNAGKSTIIEALRIIYDEELRREKIASQEGDYLKTLTDNTSDYSELKQKLETLLIELKEKEKQRPKYSLLVVCGVVFGIIIGFVTAFLIFH